MIIKTIIFVKFFLLFFSNNLFANIKNNIVLKVENEIVTNYEIKNKIISTLVLSDQEINQKNIDRLKKQALEFLIQNKLKKIELSKTNIETSTSQIDDYLKSISKNNLSLLKEKFKRNNIDFKLFKEEIETQLRWQKFIFQIYSNKIEIDEKSVIYEVNEVLKNQSDVEEFRLSEIEILINGDDLDKKKILNLKKEINEQGFEETALKFSISSSASNKGDIGWIKGKTLSKNIYNIISKMNIGEVTDEIFRQDSVLFLKLIDKKISKSSEINIEKLKKEVIAQKRNELFNMYSRSHLSKLKNSSLIEYNK
tara:strand:- start:4930 stop:5859 length:930 start_codon:yes stop_codon:yes gene_type:complete